MTVAEILKTLEICNFEDLTENNFEDKIIDPLEQELEGTDFDYFSGVTKVVLQFPNTDFVVKIPFGGTEEEEEEYDEETDEYYGTGDYNYSSFQFADDGETGDDYCKVEVNRYQDALKYDEDVASLFAQTYFIGYVYDYPIYAQAICSPLENTSYLNADDKATKTAEKSCQKYHYRCFNSVWLGEVVNYYGERIMRKLCEFIKNERIDDLHSGNIGYHNGVPIIFDYAGFND